VEVGIYAKLPANILAHKFHLSLLGSLVSYGRGGAWRWKWEHLNHGGGDWVCTISLIGCGASGAYAPGPDDKEEEIQGYIYSTYLTRSLKDMSVHELDALFYSGIFCLTTAFALSKLRPIFNLHILNGKATKEVSTLNNINFL